VKSNGESEMKTMKCEGVSHGTPFQLKTGIELRAVKTLANKAANAPDPLHKIKNNLTCNRIEPQD
jgi:hypothetical protein